MNNDFTDDGVIGSTLRFYNMFLLPLSSPRAMKVEFFFVCLFCLGEFEKKKKEN